jgi:hypothetical protein
MQSGRESSAATDEVVPGDKERRRRIRPKTGCISRIGRSYLLIAAIQTNDWMLRPMSSMLLSV